jgi:hypothetical protein
MHIIMYWPLAHWDLTLIIRWSLRSKLEDCVVTYLLTVPSKIQILVPSADFCCTVLLHIRATFYVWCSVPSMMGDRLNYFTMAVTLLISWTVDVYLLTQCGLLHEILGFHSNQYNETSIYRSRIRHSISMVPERILFQPWLLHLLFSRIHCFFFRPPTKTMNRGFTVLRLQSSGMWHI